MRTLHEKGGGEVMRMLSRVFSGAGVLVRLVFWCDGDTLLCWEREAKGEEGARRKGRSDRDGRDGGEREKEREGGREETEERREEGDSERRERERCSVAGE